MKIAVILGSIRDIRRGGRVVLDTIDENGNLLKGHYNERLVSLMDELHWWAKALKTARDKDILQK